MTKDELIIHQSIKIGELEKQIEKSLCLLKDRENRLDKIGLITYCVGGPLNDNFFMYSDKQLTTFQKILGVSDYKNPEKEQEAYEYVRTFLERK